MQGVKVDLKCSFCGSRIYKQGLEYRCYDCGARFLVFVKVRVEVLAPPSRDKKKKNRVHGFE